MPRWPAPTREVHRRFCEREGWQEVSRATGGQVGHHITYELPLPDGSVLRTRISRPPGRQTYGPSMWSHILREQLQVSEEAFWTCARDGQVPDRGQPRTGGEALPVSLVHTLRSQLHLADEQIVVLSKAQAIALLSEHWSGSAD